MQPNTLNRKQRRAQYAVASRSKPPHPPAYLDPIFHQPVGSRIFRPEVLEEMNRRMLQNHRNMERRAAWRMRCLDRLGFVPYGDVAKWRARTWLE